MTIVILIPVISILRSCYREVVCYLTNVYLKVDSGGDCLDILYLICISFVATRRTRRTLVSRRHVLAIVNVHAHHTLIIHGSLLYVYAR